MNRRIKRAALNLFWVCLSLLFQVKVMAADLVVNMRDSGYTLGDKMEMTAMFTLPKHQTIDQESLPLAGPVSHWLDIRSVQLKQIEQQVMFKITWQIFATVEIAQSLQTPEIVLRTAGDNSQKIIIPQQTFYYSPVLPMPPLKDIKRRENLVPPKFDEEQPLVYSSICAGLFFVCGFVWLWLKDYVPWLPYRAGPMTQLSRVLKATKSGVSLNPQQLRAIHVALNQSANLSLYPDNLPQLFNHAPYFRVEQDKVSRFFNQSWAHFYRDAQSTPEPIDVSDTKRWVQHVAQAERLFRRTTRQSSR